MKKNILLLVLAITSISFSVSAQNENTHSHKQHDLQKEIFTVYGNCGMCEKTIEGALIDVSGIEFKDWDKDTDLMTVKFDSSSISLNDIKQKIADVGYDSDSHRAKDSVYSSLPGCCQYDRPTK